MPCPHCLGQTSVRSPWYYIGLAVLVFFAVIGALVIVIELSSWYL